MFGTRASRPRLNALALATLAASFLASTTEAHDQIPGDEPTSVLLRGGDLYTVNEGVLEATDVLLVDGLIAAIGKDLDVPPDTQVIDVSDQRVLPGLIALHTTLGLLEIGAVRATNDLDEVGDLNPEVSARTAFNVDSEILPTVRSHGITTAQIVPQGDLLAGRTFIAHLDGWTLEEMAVPATEGIALTWPRAAVVNSFFITASPEEQKEQMARQRRDLRDFFTLALAYASSTSEDRPHDLRLEAMLNLWAETEAAPLFVEANDQRQIVEAVQFAEEFDLEMVLLGGAQADQAADLLVEHDIPVVLGWPTRLPGREEDRLDRQFGLAARLHAAGVRFALGAEDASWRARNLATEGAGIAIAFGLEPAAALRAVTLTPAEILGIDATQGSLTVGKEATLFVSSGDPFDYLGQEVTHMFIRGREVDLDNRHKTLYRKYQERIRRQTAQ